MKIERVLLTGVAGMIGSHLLDELLKRNVEVLGVDNLSFGKIANIRDHLGHDRFRFYRADVRDLESLRILARDVHWIIHLAAVKKVTTSQSSFDTLTVNTKGTENVLEVAKMWGCKVLFASTSDVYGTSTDLPFREDGDLLIGPSMVKRWSYAVSKLYGEQLCYAYYQDFNVPVVILRYFGGFSPRAAVLWSGGHIPIFVEAILRDREVVIHGDGSQTRCMSYVTDIVAGTVLSLEKDEAIGEIFNIGNEQEVSVLDMAKLVHKLANTGRPLKFRFVPFAQVLGKGYKDIMRRRPDLTKARRILGYEPKVSLETAIQHTIGAVRELHLKQNSVPPNSSASNRRSQGEGDCAT